MRESGADRDSAITFLHGFLLGKSGNSKFNLDVLARRMPPSEGAKGKLGIADLKEGTHAAEEAFG
jgi:hypothetical protein